MAASQEISASTAQLVIASRVKAREGSDSFTRLREASKVRIQHQTGSAIAGHLSPISVICDIGLSVISEPRY
jgi:hypothetical protein